MTQALKFSGFWIPAWLMEVEGSHPTHWLVWSAILALQSGEDRCCWASNQTLSDSTRIGKTVVKEAIQLGIERGFIVATYAHNNHRTLVIVDNGRPENSLPSDGLQPTSDGSRPPLGQTPTAPRPDSDHNTKLNPKLDTKLDPEARARDWIDSITILSCFPEAETREALRNWQRNCKKTGVPFDEYHAEMLQKSYAYAGPEFVDFLETCAARGYRQVKPESNKTRALPSKNNTGPPKQKLSPSEKSQQAARQVLEMVRNAGQKAIL